MPALNFKPVFRPALAAGTKIHTIRARRADGKDPKPGDTLYLYVGQRTKHCEKLAEVACVNARTVALVVSPVVVQVTLEGRPITGKQLEDFARNDGFTSADHMAAWFWRAYQSAVHTARPVNLPNLLLIQWGETEY